MLRICATEFFPTIVSAAVGQSKQPRTPQPKKSAHVHFVLNLPLLLNSLLVLVDSERSLVSIRTCNFYRSGLEVSLTKTNV
jgi:hypothetical protein